MGTEQENEGLSEAETNKLFKSIYGSLLEGKDPEVGEQPKPEETPAPQVEATETVETEFAATQEQTEVAAENNGQETSEAEPQEQDNLPEAIKNRLKELEEVARERDQLRHRLKSDEGRVAAFQRKASELERLLREKTAKQETVQSNAKLKVEESEEWRTLQESDPVLARLLKNSVEEAVRQAEEKARLAAEAATKPLYEERETEYERREREKLYQLVPNLDEVRSSPTYAQWFDVQDDAIKNLGYSAEGVYRIMQLYDADMRAQLAALEAKAGKPAPQPQVPNPKATAIEEERKRRAQAQGVASKTQAAPVELDDEAYYKKVFSQHINKR